MAFPTTIGPNPASERLLNSAVRRSKRQTATPFPPTFILPGSAGSDPPLAKMLRGGRGGEVRTKLYLTLNLIAAGAPYNINGQPARAWAETLGVPDPEVNGARRISVALNWLAEENLLTIKRTAGSPPNVTLLHPSGSGAPHSQRAGRRWINVPLGFWNQQWITTLSGPATALVLFLIYAQYHRTQSDPPWFTGSKKKQFGMSSSSWTRATAELKAHRLLSTGRAPQGNSEFDWQRMRTTYWLDLNALDTRPAKLLSSAASNPATKVNSPRS